MSNRNRNVTLLSTKNSYPLLDKYKFLFNMEELICNANLSKWFSKYIILEPILELYIENLENINLSIERRFLNMIQALETYHSRIVCSGNLSEYKKHVEKILSNVNSDIRIIHKELLLSGCDKTITLKGRIYDLLLANFEIHFDTADISYKDFPKKIADTRNYLTHYNINKKELALSGESLINAYITLKIILEYYIMKELGFKTEFIKKKIREKEERNRISRDIQEADKGLKKD